MPSIFCQGLLICFCINFLEFETYIRKTATSGSKMAFAICANFITTIGLAPKVAINIPIQG